MAWGECEKYFPIIESKTQTKINFKALYFIVIKSIIKWIFLFKIFVLWFSILQILLSQKTKNHIIFKLHFYIIVAYLVIIWYHNKIHYVLSKDFYLNYVQFFILSKVCEVLTTYENFTFEWFHQNEFYDHTLFKNYDTFVKDQAYQMHSTLLSDVIIVSTVPFESDRVINIREGERPLRNVVWNNWLRTRCLNKYFVAFLIKICLYALDYSN